MDDNGHLSSDFDLIILDMNKWADTSPNQSRTECQYQVNEQNDSHTGKTKSTTITTS